MVTDSLLNEESSARLKRIDGVLAALPVPAEAQRLGVAGAVGWMTETRVDPEVMRASWGKLHQFTLYPWWMGDPSGLDALIALWTKQVLATRPAPDSQALVQWPSRDVDAGRVFRAHGLTPGLTAAVRVHPSPDAGPSVGLASDVVVRPARADDLDVILGLFLEQLTYPVGLDPTTIRPSTRPAGRVMLADAIDQEWVWIAELRGTVCGFLRATRPEDTTFWRPASPAPSNWVVLLAVTAEHRGRGVGAALVDTAHRAFSAAGVRATVLHYTTLNPLSVPFWSRHGYRPLWSLWSTWPANAVTGNSVT